MCDILRVSETGYYRFVRNLGKPGKDAVLSAAMKRILDESPFNDNYGVDRMRIALSSLSIYAGRRRIARIMRENGWLHERRRRPKGLTKATAEIQEKENLIKQDFHSSKPFRKLLTDISQIGCLDGKLYISPIMDCYNGEILALQMQTHMRAVLCIDTLKAACQRFPIKGAVLHSDRGSQYTSEAFRKELEVMHIRQSLSGVDHCYDNARMESFFATLKNVVGKRAFPDHYQYTDDDLQKLRAAAARRGAKLVTTEKDWMRLPVDMRDEIKFARLDMTLDDNFWTWLGDKIKCLH